MAGRRFLVTGALPYSNNRLHVGHIAGAYLPADIFVRYLRSNGDDVRFICGSDDNGVAIEISAMKEGSTPQAVSAKYNALQQEAFEGLGIHFDIYGGTHQPDFVETHNRLSQDFFKSIHDNGHFVKKKTEQLFDVQAGKFLPDRFVKGACYHKLEDGSPCGNPESYGDQCEQCGNTIDALQLINPISTITNTTPEKRETTHWYLKLGKFQGMLADWFSITSLDWRPTVTNFCLGAIKKGLPERAMTRDLSWGVPVPLDDPDAANKVLYVWFDAPIGYVSFTAALAAQQGRDWREYQEWWQDPDCRIVHFIGEDNIVFHALIWPAMLLGTQYTADEIEKLGADYKPREEAGYYQLPHNVVANSFLNIKFPGKGEEEKISKSRGTAVWIDEYLRTFDPDPLRYYLTVIAPENQRTAWSFDDFVERNNNELIATLGNFINRWQKIVTEHFDRRVPARDRAEQLEVDLLATIGAVPDSVGEDIEATRFKSALNRIMDAFRACNRYIDEREPWKTRKSDLDLCATTVHTCIQAVRTLGVVLEPFLPFASEKIRVSLGVDKDAWTWPRATEALPIGHALGPAPDVLFRKLDIKEFSE
ncbi:MAG TPA: class I tRNA ligase family protein [Phycisphaerae bacterium]|nr:class I tRNA ligase family protein [Phycisphaerae bacterium]HRW52878.1 class I tRNA ligase family protein [Phycisphaerae bacterium]